jgi:hypothetical protein
MVSRFFPSSQSWKQTDNRAKYSKKQNRSSMLGAVLLLRLYALNWGKTKKAACCPLQVL